MCFFLAARDIEAALTPSGAKMAWSPLDQDGYDVDQLGPAFALPEFRAMPEPANVPIIEEVRKSVLFVGTREKGKFRPRATAFIVSIADEDVGFRYVVTADHVVSHLLAGGHEIWLRSNKKDGTAQEDNWSKANWMFHPDVGSTDVAIAPIDFSPDEDFRSIVLSGNNSMAATQEILKRYWVHVGHEVIVTGLFRSHYGQQRNIPIIRTGNIAMMLGEKVHTKHCGYTDAYLIEARSISGLSGSPVFITVDDWAGGQIIGKRTYLLGLMHGHFDVPNLAEDIVIDTDDEPRGINTGIGVVIPVEKILETINQPEIQAMRKKGIEAHKKAKGATADLDLPPLASPSNDENPNHRADFNVLLDKAAKKTTED